MGTVYDRIIPELQTWLGRQHMFTVATAPLAAEGHVNCSPKGGDTFRVLGPREVAYADLTGSGIETVAHLRENGRIVLMFCAYEGAPQIVRLHGRGEVVDPDDAGFEELRAHFPALVGLRTIIRVRVTRIADSCGFAVPRYDFVAPRDVLDRYSEKLGPAGLAEYRAKKNRTSIDGLPGLS
ncbi:MAG: hypothetical protein RLZZ129_1565 [Verrucomicrobiota bacterium]|jgi:hypothetical protein